MWPRRCDGVVVRRVPAYRRIMPYLMRGRNESITLFDAAIDVSKTTDFLEDFNRQHPSTPATLFHVVLWAMAKTLGERPRLNRFVAGGRLYQRDGIWLSFAAKKVLDEEGPLEVVKRTFQPDEPFPLMVAGVDDAIRDARSSAASSTDRELAVLLHLPGLALRAVLALERFLDAFGLLPRFFIKGDPMFASVFLANMGSLKMDAVFHHLYEYGNVGVFCSVGQITQEAVVRNGMVVAAPSAHLRFSFDERIDDGMYAHRSLQLLQRLVEDPAAGGCEISTLAPVEASAAAGAQAPGGRRAAS